MLNHFDAGVDTGANIQSKVNFHFFRNRILTLISENLKLVHTENRSPKNPTEDLPT